VTEEKRQTLGQMRRHIMLDAATELFLEKGFERTSLSDIISRSKGSRSTLYEQFGNKEGLLRAMIEDTCCRSWEDVSQDLPSSSFDEEALVEFGMKFVNRALTPHMLAVFRIMVTESHLVPEMAKLFFETGPQFFKQRLTEEFRAVDNNKLSDDTAVVFLGAIMGDLHFRQALGFCSISQEEIKSHVRNAVRIFLHGVGQLGSEAGARPQP
jgi:AcrR family transcriptional regulator